LMGPDTEDKAQRTWGGGLSAGHRQTQNINVVLFGIWQRNILRAGRVEKIGEHF